MSQRESIHSAGFAILVVLTFSVHASGQVPTHLVSVVINQTPKIDGGFEYSLEASRIYFGIQDLEWKLFAPDGTEFSIQSGEIYGDTFEEIAVRAFGDWTANQKIGGIESTFDFRFLPFDRDSVSHLYPVIISPANSAVVPPDFAISWSLDDGSSPEYFYYSTKRSPNYSYTASASDSTPCCLISIDGTLVDPGPGWLQVQAKQAHAVPIPYALSQIDGSVGSVGFSAAYVLRSLNTTFIIVPEPSGLLLLAFAGLCGLVLRYR